MAGSALFPNTQILFACVHSRVVEMFYDSGQLTNVTVDEVVA